MAWRKWVYRSALGTAAGAALLTGWLVYAWTNADSVRQQVAEQLQAQFPGAEVELGSATLRVLGGISVRDLRLYRRDDPARVAFLTVPSAVIYHDKQKLLRGRIVVRKVELQRPRLRIRREPDGSWNLSDVMAPSAGPEAADTIPTFVFDHGVVQFEDRSAGERPMLEVREFHWVLLNDPPSVLSFEGRGATAFGPLGLHGVYEPKRQKLNLSVELPDVSVGPSLARELAAHLPEAAEHLRGLDGTGDARLGLTWAGGESQALKHDLTVNLRQGRFRHPKLPLPLEDLNLTARCRGRDVTLEHLTARAGTTTVSLNLDAELPPDDFLGDWESLLKRVDLTVGRLNLSPELFARLPPKFQAIQRRFGPDGPVGVTYRQTRDPKGWRKQVVLRPEGMCAAYERFRYPLKDLRGSLDQLITSDGTDRLKIDLIGSAGERPLTVVGTYEDADGPNEFIDLTIRGRDLPLDETLVEALGKNADLARAFHATGRADATVTVKQERGEQHTVSRFLVQFRDVAACYERFPYPLENMTGTLDITIGPAADQWVFRDFRGQYHGGEVRIGGRNDPGPTGDVLTLNVEGAGVPLDAAFARALTQIKLHGAWKVLEPRGRMNFHAQVRHVSRPGAAPDVEVSVPSIQADSIRPDFFPYELTNVRSNFQFAAGRLVVQELEASHGPTRVKLGPCDLILKPGGGLWAQANDLSVSPMVPDDELVAALPPSLKALFAALQPQGPMTFSARELVVDLTPANPVQPPPLLAGGGPAPIARMSSGTLAESEPYSPWVYWDGARVTFEGSSLKAGLTWTDVFGELASRGEYRNGRLGAIDGNLLIQRAAMLNQPVSAVHARLLMDPRDPGVLQVRNLKGKLFGGDVGGEARLALGPVFRYDLALKAMQMRLEEFARGNTLGPNAELSGTATAQLFLTGQGSDVSGLRGGGTIDIPKGHVYNLPPLLDLLKFFKLNPPDRTLFEEAHARFRVQGKRVVVEQIDLFGNLLSLTGNGELDFDGSNAHFDVYTLWTRMTDLFPGVARDVPNALSRSLFKVEVTGTVGGKMDYRKEAVPVITEPIERLLKRFQ